MNRRHALKKLLQVGGASGLTLAAAKGAPAAPKKVYYRVCQTCVFNRDKFGPDRDTRKEAENDVKEHVKKFPGHSCDVLEGYK